MADTETQRRVDLPADVVARVEARLPHTEFDTTSEYVTYVLEEVLTEVDETVDADVGVDENQVQERLQSLGYLDA